MPARTLFDEAYYARFYGGAAERRAYRREEQRLGDFLFAYLAYLEQPVERVADIGCGLGQWQDIVAEHAPKARYTGVEWSQYLCREYGWVQASVVDFDAPEPFDFIICKDTLQYLPPKAFDRGLENLARLCRGVLYLSVLTTEDVEGRCDPARTDDAVYLRPGQWYRRRLERWFTNLGGGLFLSPQSPVIAWELEQLPMRGR